MDAAYGEGVACVVTAAVENSKVASGPSLVSLVVPSVSRHNRGSLWVAAAASDIKGCELSEGETLHKYFLKKQEDPATREAYSSNV